MSHLMSHRSINRSRSSLPNESRTGLSSLSVKKRQQKEELGRLQRELEKTLAAVEVKEKLHSRLLQQQSELKESVQDMEERIGSYSEIFTAPNAKAKRPMGRVFASRDNRLKLDKCVDLAHKELLRVRGKVAEAIGENEEIKQRINLLRREKQIYRQVFENLEIELQKIKAECKLIESKVVADYKARDEAQLQMINAQKQYERNKKRMESLLLELDDKSDIIDTSEIHQLSNESTTNKNMKNTKKDLNKSLNKKKSANGLRDRIKKLSIRKIGASATTSKMKNIDYYEKLWEKISKSTGVDDIDELVLNFMKLEQHKMSRVREANSLISEIKDVQIECRDMDVERKEYKIAKRQQLVNNLESETEKIKDQINDFQLRTKEYENSIRSMLPQLRKLYDIVGGRELSEKLSEFLAQPVDISQGDEANNNGFEAAIAATDGISEDTDVLSDIHLIKKDSKETMSAVSPKEIVKLLAFVENRVHTICHVMAAFSHHKRDMRKQKGKHDISSPKAKRMSRKRVNIDGTQEAIAEDEISGRTLLESGSLIPGPTTESGDIRNQIEKLQMVIPNSAAPGKGDNSTTFRQSRRENQERVVVEHSDKLVGAPNKKKTS